ncbi:MAG: hypothetical protein L0K86_01255 [Actinomycetia bacterium]|nr:hypothetical protein [Actinomycetes bacterium]
MRLETRRLPGVVGAEWSKWTSTSLLARYVGTGVALSVGIAGLIAVAMDQANDYCAEPGHDCSSPPIEADNVIATAGIMGDGTPGAGLIALMLRGATCVLVEYRYGTIKTAFFATPQRWRVILAKVVLTAGIAFVAILIAAPLSSLVFKLLGGTAADMVEPWSAQTALISLRTATVVALAAAGAVGVAAAIRNSMGAIGLIVMWPLVIEPLLPSMLPGAADVVAGFLPFANARYFIGLGGSEVDFFWGQMAAGGYFAAVMAAVVGVGVAVTERANIR